MITSSRVLILFLAITFFELTHEIEIGKCVSEAIINMPAITIAAEELQKEGLSFPAVELANSLSAVCTACNCECEWISRITTWNNQIAIAGCILGISNIIGGMAQDVVTVGTDPLGYVELVYGLAKTLLDCSEIDKQLALMNQTNSTSLNATILKEVEEDAEAEFESWVKEWEEADKELEQDPDEIEVAFYDNEILTPANWTQLFNGNCPPSNGEDAEEAEELSCWRTYMDYCCNSQGIRCSRIGTTNSTCASMLLWDIENMYAECMGILNCEEISNGIDGSVACIYSEDGDCESY
jgi:hypothetical protein